ncbi:MULTISPECIES: trimeric intracellular cation channel family protein [unclassified Ruegeria]|uniref:TRIC cation channel family protein n=1 Tax=unclassified Ruegeria TaxID=2625375 RepID=UPI001488B54C|nr:trimeric intracellular cation channel family protein [Ruegeria sp. HKCCD5849]NOD53831.1 trimeric intracellular cation channel family protein [Ruegeria sp. HKCCD5851]NOD69846.1 trimeric intracellular cation channel family protein [Ruegeria sp. HKCCD7303]NOE35475.1 trimeric intracellular cation channel family protein [Ruegeria sp. HKCCD7318]
MTALSLLDYASVLIFALTGALVASRAQLDLVGFAFMACLTAVGGGTVRDLLLDRHPIFWVGQPDYILIAVAASVLVFFTAHLMESRYNWLIWLDSFALSVAVAAGTGAALSLDQSGVIVVLMGVTTGCLGGLMRDVVCNEVPLVLKQGELYVSCAFAGSLTAVLAVQAGTEPALALALCALVCWALRAGSLVFGWQLPVYKSRPPRN